MKLLCVGFLSVLLGTACSNSTDNSKTPSVKPDTARYYPIAVFFKRQIEYVDLRNFDIRYSHTLDDKKDSAQLTKELFIKCGNPFLQQAKYFEQNRQLFRENVFEDLSTLSYTLNYTPFQQPAVGIQHLDVLLDIGTRNPKRVLVKVMYTSKDTSITEQYNWKSFESFQLIRFKQAGTNFSSSEVTYVTWNKKR